MENSPAIALFLALGIVILSARIAGGIARRFHQPRVLGELIVGVILGPTLLDILHSSALGLNQAHLEETIKELSEFGVLLLMFKVGLDVHFAELIKVGKVAVFAGVAGALLPVLLTYPIVALAGYNWQAALFAGVTLAATSVSISAQVLLELGVLQTTEGNALLASALIDDVVAILLVSFAVAITGSEQSADLGTLVGIVLRMTGYLVGAFLLAWFVVPRLMNWIHKRPEIAQSYGLQAVALVLALLFGWSAEVLGGVAAITGAFIAGIGLSRCRENIKRPIDDAVSNIAYVLLVPIFFVSVGLEVNLRDFQWGALPLAAALMIVAVSSKIFGCGYGAHKGGFNRQQSLRLGVCMISRGEVGLIIVSLGLANGVFNLETALFPALFLVILLSTVITPPLVRRMFHTPTPIQEAAHG